MMILEQSNSTPRENISFYWMLPTYCVLFFFTSFHVFIEISICLLIQRNKNPDNQTKISHQIASAILYKILTIRLSIDILLTANKDIIYRWYIISIFHIKILPFFIHQGFLPNFMTKTCDISKF